MKGKQALSQTSLPTSDDPVERIAQALRTHGWTVTRERGKWPSYVATSAGGDWTATVRPGLHGLRALISVQRPDGVTLLPMLASREQEDRFCRLIGLRWEDLWRRDLVDGLRDIA